VVFYAFKSNSIDYFEKSTDYFAENHNRILLSGFSVLNDSNSFWAFVVTILTI